MSRPIYRYALLLLFLCNCARYNAAGSYLALLALTSGRTASPAAASGPVITGGNILGTLTFSGSPTITTIAGGPPPAAASGNLDGTGTAARFNRPDGIATDGYNLYVSDDNNNQIRKVVIATGVVTTQAPVVGVLSGMTTDGTNLYFTTSNKVWTMDLATNTQTAIASGFSNLQGITNDGTYLYVCDQGGNLVYKIAISTGATVWSTALASPYGITSNGSTIFVASYGNPNNLFVSIDPASGTVTVLTNVPQAICPSATNPQIIGIVTDGTYLYGACASTLVKYDSLTTGGTVSQMAGTSSGYTDGAALTVAQMVGADYIVSDGTALYFTDYNDHSIRRYY